MSTISTPTKTSVLEQARRFASQARKTIVRDTLRQPNVAGSNTATMGFDDGTIVAFEDSKWTVPWRRF